MMISAWWLLAAFLAGGLGGIFVMALMQFASEEPETTRYIGRMPRLHG